MMDNFLKRLLMTIAYWVGAMCLIHLMMATDPSYQRNWLFIFTGQIVLTIGLVLKIGFFIALAIGGFYLASAAIQLHESWHLQVEEAAQKKNDEEVARRAAAHHAMAARAREVEAIAEEKRKKQELEEHRRKIHAERFGPRGEDDALEKAMASIKFGGFE